MKPLAIALSALMVLTAPLAHAGGGGGSSRTSSNLIDIDWTLGEGSYEAEHSSAIEALGVDEGNPRVVVMPAIVVPLVTDNRLNGYAYIHSRVLVAEGQRTSAVVENVHFALDRLIRASHRTNLTAESGDTIDIERTTEVWMATLSDHFGEGVIQRMAIMTPDVRLIR
ncbi:hypothetical protein [Hyphobacterium sp.]|jgi:hypothetical protein|uniref:hypothetical protein n=1 Tax=Hyphobacterium sp. TaxID=2004662 RepID=UPI003BA95CFD